MNIFRYKIQINIFQRCAIHRFIFKMAKPFGIHKRQPVLKRKFFGFIPYTDKGFIRLVGM